MLSDEEKKAIEYLKRHIIPCYGRKGTIEFMLNDIVLNLIEKQQKEIEELDRNLKFDDLLTPYGKNEDMMWTEIIKQHNKINEIIRYIKRKDKTND